MDNDLMARRLRPPSEPFQPAPPSQLSPTEPAPWDPLAREDVPWDRPTDYAEQTDSATPDQPAWDRPSNSEWFDSEPAEDRTPEDERTSDMPHRAESQEVASDWSEFASEPVSELVSDPEPEAHAESAWPAEAPGQTSWITSAVEPTGLMPGLGPTPPAELFDDRPVDLGREDSPGWEVAFGPESDQAPEPASETEPEPEPDPALEPEPDPASMSDPSPVDELWASEPVTVSVSPYSTAPAPPTPFVVPIVSTSDHSPDTAVVDVELTPRHAAFESRGPVAPEPPSDSAWIEPMVAADFEQSDWTEPVSQSQAEPRSEPQPVPWGELPAPESPTRYEAGLAPIPPQGAEFAPPPWAQPAYEAESVAQPAAPSPFAPAAAPTYAPAMYSDPLPGPAARPVSQRADANLAEVTPVNAQHQGDLWFLSTEPADVDAPDVAESPIDAKKPSPILTGILTIGVAVLVIVLVLVFIQLMTSLLR